MRPKKEAWRHLPGELPHVVEPGYWWLTWAWDNHLFACQSCNTGLKKSHFPLAPGTRPLVGPTPPYKYKRLRPDHLDTSVEQAWFIDPSRVDPLDHIVWRPANQTYPKRRWLWSPEGLTDEGKATIKVLHLDELADDVADHLRDNALARALEVCAHIDAGRRRPALAAWNALGRDVAGPTCHLAGPTWNALHYLVEPHRRAKAGLPDLLRP